MDHPPFNPAEQDYPRDMLGYGETPPDPQWPNNAAIAVQFVVNYEEGGENNILHGDKASEAFLSEIVGATPWPDQRHWNMESIYEYGARAGFWRLHRMFTSRELPVTVYGVAEALQRSPAQVQAMQDAGWEIASHGLKWVEYKDATPEEEMADIEKAIVIHEEVTGEMPRGWYTGRCSMNTVDLTTEIGIFDYVSDSYADDLPYWHHHAGMNQLVIPYTLDCNDMRFATPQGFNSGDQFFAYLKDTFDVLRDEGRAGAPKMMNIGLHCRLAGRPGRAAALGRFLDYITSFSDVWVCTRQDIADHWHAHHAPKREDADEKRGVDVKAHESASAHHNDDLESTGAHAGSEADNEMNHQDDAFVAAFGDIYEHSPWVAERAFAKDPVDISDVDEVIAAMASAFASASDEERLGVLNAHPDLAGKLAAAKQLTADSTEEQASAGLDQLTDDERDYFTALNESYKDIFDFPFIIAVKGLKKADILASFEQRLLNTVAEERTTAEAEVQKIARLRLEAMLA